MFLKVPCVTGPVLSLVVINAADVSFNMCISCVLGIHPMVRLLDHMVVLLFNLKGNLYSIFF